MRVYAAFLLLLTHSAWSADIGFFPLEIGNLWVYESAGSRCCTPLILEITGANTFNGSRYFLLHSSTGDDYWLRDDGASVFAYDPQTDLESLWYDFQIPQGQAFATALPRSSGQAIVSSRGIYSGPAGAFENSLTVAYPGVGQNGFAREVFAPDVGLVQRIEYTGDASIASYQLVYARLNGNTLRRSPAVASGITGRVLRGPVCPVQSLGNQNCADQPVAALLSIRTASRSQEVSIAASDEGGNFRLILSPGDYVVVYQALNGSKFPSATPQTVTVLPNAFADVTIRLDTGIR